MAYLEWGYREGKKIRGFNTEPCVQTLTGCQPLAVSVVAGIHPPTPHTEA